MSVKELVKEINWLIEKIDFSLKDWHDDSLLNHSHSSDGNFVLIDAVLVKTNLIERLEFLKDQLGLMKHKIEEPPKD